MTNNIKTYITQITLFCLSAPFSLIYSIFVLFTSRNYSKWLISFSLSLFFLYSPLLYDTASNFKKYIQCKHYNCESEGLYIDAALKFNEYLGVSFFGYIFILTSFSFYIFIKILNDRVKKEIDCRNIVFLTSVLLLSFVYRDIMDLHRNYISISVLVYTIYMVINCEVKNGGRKLFTLAFSIPLLVLSFAIHQSSLIIIGLIIVSYCYSKIVFLKKFDVFFLLVLLFSAYFIGTFLVEIVDILPLPKNIKAIASFYLESEKWGKIDYSHIGNVFKKLIDIVFILTCVIALLKSSISRFSAVLVLLLCALILVFLDYRTLYERSFIALSAFLVLKLLYYPVKKKFKVFILLAFIMKFFVYNVIVFGSFFNGSFDEVNDLELSEKKHYKYLYIPPIYLIDQGAFVIDEDKILNKLK